MRLEAITGIPGFPARSFVKVGEDLQPGDGEWHSVQVATLCPAATVTVVLSLRVTDGSQAEFEPPAIYSADVNYDERSRSD